MKDLKTWYYHLISLFSWVVLAFLIVDLFRVLIFPVPVYEPYPYQPYPQPYLNDSTMMMYPRPVPTSYPYPSPLFNSNEKEILSRIIWIMIIFPVFIIHYLKSSGGIVKHEEPDKGKLEFRRHFSLFVTLLTLPVFIFSLAAVVYQAIFNLFFPSTFEWYFAGVLELLFVSLLVLIPSGVLYRMLEKSTQNT